MPITTILHTVNGTEQRANGTSRGGRAYADTAPANSLGSNSGKTHSKGVNLAELLKRTELKTVPSAEGRRNRERSTTTEANAMQFAQLENYKHHINVKNLQDLLKYVTCRKAADCGGGDLWQSTTVNGLQSTTFGMDADLAESVETRHRADGDARIVDDDQRLQVIILLSVFFAILLLIIVYTFIVSFFM